jgi:hypothetical protein
LPATALDAAAVAISTALIIGMVGSLVFFLIIAFYRGQYDARLMYIFGLYTAATVLIARIAIDSGRAYATAFSVPLAIVSILAIMRFVSVGSALGPISWLINVALLAIAWYLADRITFDCTLISERQRSLQQGLLQSLGLVQQDSTLKRAEQSAAQRLNATMEATRSTDTIQKRKHNPGVWVLYFALLAFPLFGLGQLAIPEEQRGLAFTFLMSYLACALCLLVLTALVGMRRYLRQRGVEMPAEISLHWITLGAGSTIAILLLCWLLPLPGRTLGLMGVPPGFDTPQSLQASRWGWGGEQSSDQTNPQAAGHQAEEPQDTPPPAQEPRQKVPANGPPQADGQGAPQADDQAAGESSVSGEQSQSQPTNPQKSSPASEERTNKPTPNSPNPASDSSQDPTQPSADQRGDDNRQSADKRPREAQASDEATPASDPGQESENTDTKNTESQSNSPPATRALAPWLNQFGSLADWIKWLTIAILAIIVLAYAITHPGEIAQFWQQLLVWWAALWGRPASSASAQVESTASKPQVLAPRRPFSSFVNPFTSQAAGWTPAQVIEHSFAALESWGAEQGKPRQEQQTAAEFARQIAATHPALGPHALAAANMLDQLMFAGWKPKPDDVKPLAQLWQRFSR